MAKQQFDLVRDLNKATSVISHLAVAIAEAGGDPGSVFEKLDTEDPNVITVMRSAGELLAPLSSSPMALLRGAFAGTWNKNLSDANFPGMDANAFIEGVRPVKIGGAVFDREKAKIFLEAMSPSMRPARLDKCIRWCVENPDYQLRQGLFCFAESWVDPSGVEYVVFFGSTSAGRVADLYGATGRWFTMASEVLAERMTEDP